MRAFSTANGGVMFVADHIERMEKPLSYKDLVQETKTAKPFSLVFSAKVKKSPISSKPLKPSSLTIITIPYSSPFLAQVISRA